MSAVKTENPKFGFTSGGKVPEDGGQAILDQFNPYQLFAGDPDSLTAWEKDNDAVVHLDLGDPGVTPLVVCVRPDKEHEHLTDWAVYALAPYRPTGDDGLPFIAIPIGHGITDPVAMYVRTQQIVRTLQRGAFTTAVLDVFHDQSGKPIAAVVLGNGFGRTADETTADEAADGADEAAPTRPRPHACHTMYYPVGITASGVKLLVPPGREAALSYGDAKALAEGFFQKVTQG